jgi:hypothetical protein
MVDGLLLLVAWTVPAVVLFFVIYWAVRLAIRDERRRAETPREARPRRRKTRRPPE